MDESLPGPWNTYPRGKRRRKKKEGDVWGVACSFQGRKGTTWAAESGDEEEIRGGDHASPAVAKGIGLCVHEAYPKGMDPHNDLVTNYLDRKYYRHEPRESHALARERMPGPIICASCPFGEPMI